MRASLDLCFGPEDVPPSRPGLGEATNARMPFDIIFERGFPTGGFFFAHNVS
jgi:hypothetical protein